MAVDMESLKRQLRVMNLNLQRQNSQFAAYLKKDPMDFETLSKMEAQIKIDFLPLKEKYDFVVFEMLAELDEKDNEQEKQIQQLLKYQDKLREVCALINSKIKHITIPLKEKIDVNLLSQVEQI